MSSVPLAHDAGAPSALDSATLERLRELDPEGRHGVVPRVLQAFEAALERNLVQLRAEPPIAPAALGAMAHTLKSSAASVGALALARACEALELQLRQGVDVKSRDVSALSSLIEQALESVRSVLRRSAQVHG